MDYLGKAVCCFTGHRIHKLPFRLNEDCPKCHLLKRKLEEEIVRLIDDFHVAHFISGMASGTDTFAAEIVLALQRTYADITLECAIPFAAQAQNWTEEQQDRYYNIIKQCNEITLLQSVYTKDCMQKRNRYMVDRSDYVIGVWKGTPGGTAVCNRATEENTMH